MCENSGWPGQGFASLGACNTSKAASATRANYCRRVDDYVHAENPVRFIDAFVDGLDLAAAGFGRVQLKETGRPGYDPADLLWLYIYSYRKRVRSSRRLEAETHRNLEVIWMLRGLRPDFKTIAAMLRRCIGRCHSEASCERRTDRCQMIPALP